MLHGKKILLGVTGSIAAYKAAYLVRLLRKKGAVVKVIMTSGAAQFITPLTLGTLSTYPVLTEFADDQSGEWNNHVELGLWADLLIVAPATANTISKMANGICDNLLTAVYLSARCPVVVAPAMDLDMHDHVTTQDSIHKLKRDGVLVIDAEEGELASGLQGVGRMAEPDHIVDFLDRFFSKQNQLKDYHVMITAGPTYEPIDPVRFIGNQSSGKMGYALAEAFAFRGAQVTLISGPSHESVFHQRVNVVHVTTAEEMYQAVLSVYQNTDVMVLAAAVADYRPKNISPTKLKKKELEITLELEKTRDIAAELGKLKTNKQFLVGFALETDHALENAKNKIKDKKLDAIVLNSLQNPGAGFQHDTNQVTIIDKEENEIVGTLKTKRAIADDIVDFVYQQFFIKKYKK